jgi:hypothetical protein
VSFIQTLVQDARCASRRIRDHVVDCRACGTWCIRSRYQNV